MTESVAAPRLPKSDR